jgi:hypothetical protein
MQFLIRIFLNAWHASLGHPSMGAWYFLPKYAAIGKPAKNQGNCGSPRETVEKQ